MPLLCASRNAGGTIVSARFLPRTSSRVQPNVVSACAFHATIAARRIDADEGIVRRVDDQAAPELRFPPAGRARSAVPPRRGRPTMRLATEIAKFCSSTVQMRAPPTCSAQSTPTVVLSCRSGTSSMAPMSIRDQVGVAESRRCADRSRASSAATTRSRSMRVEIGRRIVAVQQRAPIRSGRRCGDTGPTQRMIERPSRTATCSAVRPRRASAADLEDAPQPLVESLAGIGVARR